MVVFDEALANRFMQAAGWPGMMTSLDEIQAHVDDHRDVFAEGSVALCDSVIEGRLPIAEALAWLDTAKSVTARSLSSLAASKGVDRTGPTLRMPATGPGAVDTYMNEWKESTALLSMHMIDERGLLIIAVANYPIGGSRGEGVVQYRCTLIRRLESGFRSAVNDFADSVEHGEPEFSLLRRPFSALALAIRSLLGEHLPETMIFVPHRELHVLPLHAMQIGDDHLHNSTHRIRYCASVHDAVTSTNWVRTSDEEAAVARNRPVVSSIYDEDSALPGVALVKDVLTSMESHGSETVRFRSRKSMGELPAVWMDDVWLNWHSHARSSAASWGGSFLTLAGQAIAAASIARDWRFPRRPHVFLGACVTALDGARGSATGEYGGLDTVFRIAGARSVVGSLWDVSDPVATLLGIRLLSSYLQTGSAPARPLTAMQRAMRIGTWKHTFLSEQQLRALDEESADRMRAYQAAFRRFPDNAFQAPRHWAAMRAHG